MHGSGDKQKESARPRPRPKLKPRPRPKSISRSRSRPRSRTRPRPRPSSESDSNERKAGERAALSLSVCALSLSPSLGRPSLSLRACVRVRERRAGGERTDLTVIRSRPRRGVFSSLLEAGLGLVVWWYTGPKPVRGHRGPAPRTTTKSVNEPEERGHRGPAPRDETCECKGPGNNHGKQSPGSPDWAPSQTYASQAVRNQGESSLV